jgi:hypothetical protein
MSVSRNNGFRVALAIAGLSWAGLCAAEAPGTVNEERLEQQITQLQQQLDLLKAQLQQLKSENQALAAQQQQQAAQAQMASAAAPSTGISPDLSLWGYGEIYYTHPVHDAKLTEMDLARAVFGIGYKFDERTVFNSEFEIEHAVASADDAGEFEVEQFFIDHQLAASASIKAGLFLMPFGLLNEHHEPTNYYGVQRNFVETLIIPSTWREGGVGFHGTTAIGLSWDVGVTTGMNLADWENNPPDPLYRTALQLEDNNVAPLQATHQELQFANAQHLSQYVSLNYAGMPGLLVGAAVFTGEAAVPTVPAGLPDQRVTLWEGHARWTPGAADFAAVYARGSISNTAPYNFSLPGATNPMPAQFLGYYLQGAYTLWQHGGVRLSPFIRWEHYDMGAAYEGIPPGFSTVPPGLASDGEPWPQPNDRVWTFGANFYINPHVVFKADYQDFSVNSNFTRFDLGMGLSF